MNETESSILKLLNWNNPQEMQNEGLKLAKNSENYSFLIQPNNFLFSWENCARVLVETDDSKIQPHIFSLLEWVKDINWPGASMILDRLKRMPSSLIREPLEYAVNLAIENNDKEWLDYLSALYENSELQRALDLNVNKVLRDHYKDFWV